MASPVLDGIRAKLKRAEEHLDVLEAEMGNYLGGDIYILVRDEKPDRTIFHLWIKAEPPLRFSILLGDCCHNLRSALDHIVWQMVLANKQTPDENTAFPIWDKPPQGIFAPKAIRGISKEACALIESLQPYQDGQQASEHVLWFIKTLSNTDKHRTLNLTVASISDLNVKLITSSREHTATIPRGVFRHGAEVASFAIPSDEIVREDVRVESRGDIFIALKDPGPWGPEEPILTLMEQASRYMRFALLPAVERLPEMQ
jgi:hypothetical protein